MAKDIEDAIKLLQDENLIWSSDLESIRRNLARLIEKIYQLEYHYLEPEIGDLALNLTREREKNAGEFDSTEEAKSLLNSGLTGQAR